MQTPKLSLRSLLIAIHLVVLVLPLAGIQVMRLYESALVRQTESALIAQAAFVSAYYRARLTELAGNKWRSYGKSIDTDNPKTFKSGWAPRPAELDLATSPRLPAFPDGRQIEKPNPLAAQVGRSLSKVLKDAQLTTLAGIRVVDPQGVIVATTANDTGNNISQGEEVALALQGIPASRLRIRNDASGDDALSNVSRTSRVRVFVTTPILQDDLLVGAVLLSRTPPSVVQALSAKRWLLLSAAAILVAIVLFMTWVTVQLIARPIRALADRADRIAEGDQHAENIRTHPARTSEIARLEHAINDMATSLQERANYLQSFAQHISHEFKTPIASINGAIEVLQDHVTTMSPAQRDKFFANIAADAERMQRLTQRLMDLAQADLKSESTRPVDISAAIESACQSFRDILKIEVALAPGNWEVSGAADALSSSLTILLENAAQHNATKARIELVSATQGALLTVTDNGDGISSGNREKIFTPFFTTKRESGGTGLGLSIATALLKQIEGRLRLTHHQRTQFVIELPEASRA